MNVFSFACACELCSLPLIARTESDYRLDQIWSISEDEGAATNLDQVLEHPAESFSQVHRLFELLEEEGICDIRIAPRQAAKLPNSTSEPHNHDRLDTLGRYHNRAAGLGLAVSHRC